MSLSFIPHPSLFGSQVLDLLTPTMFWKFDLHTSSHLEALLDKEDVTLTELMDEEDVLQECKAQNRRYIYWFPICISTLKWLLSWHSLPLLSWAYCSVMDSQTPPVLLPGPMHARASSFDYNRTPCWRRRDQALQVSVFMWSREKQSFSGCTQWCIAYLPLYPRVY